jgi:RNA polymerase sigma factor (sigma-70 family)
MSGVHGGTIVMVDGRTSRAALQVARIFQDGTFLGLSDRQVLERFVAERDEAAFEVLIARHGPMVRRVCRQLLIDPHDGDDAFQAVFLALVRKAKSIRVDESLGPWLYRVANRVAARARSQRTRLAAREPSNREPTEAAGQGVLDGFEIHHVVHEELGRLPERLRAPIVLCYLEGMTHDLVARQLNCPVGTVRSRLAKARGVLERRLSRRGFTVAAVALGGVLESTAQAASIAAPVSAPSVTLVARAACQAARSGGLHRFRPITDLYEGVTKMFPIQKLAILAITGVSVGAVAFVLAARSKVAGQTAVQKAEFGVTEVDDRRLGPDGRPIGSPGANSKTATITKTYFVGDLLLAQRRASVVGIQISRTAPSTTPAKAVGDSSQALDIEVEQPQRPELIVNYTPLLELITQTVAPGTWTVRDEQGQPIPSANGGAKNLAPQLGGSITPFRRSLSLIIKCKPEVHQDVAHLIRGVRALVLSRDQADAQSASRSESSAAPSSIPATASASSSDSDTDAETERLLDVNAKIERLLDEVREEVKKLDRMRGLTSSRQNR